MDPGLASHRDMRVLEKGADMSDTRARSWQAEEQQTEVELCTTLMIASSGTERVLPQDQVDQLLGVHPPTRATSGH